MTREEAKELNSECYICKKEKFQIVPRDGAYDLVRCTVENCDKHCQFNHESTYNIMDASEDTVSIGAGWSNR